MIEEYEKKLTTPIINPDTGLEVKKNAFISAPYVPDLSEKFRSAQVYRSSSKEPTP